MGLMTAESMYLKSIGLSRATGMQTSGYLFVVSVRNEICKIPNDYEFFF